VFIALHLCRQELSRGGSASHLVILNHSPPPVTRLLLTSSITRSHKSPVPMLLRFKTNSFRKGTAEHRNDAGGKNSTLQAGEVRAKDPPYSQPLHTKRMHRGFTTYTFENDAINRGGEDHFVSAPTRLQTHPDNRYSSSGTITRLGSC
jgi:hypothetical protein